MSAADRFLHELEQRSNVVETPAGRVQVAREGTGPAVLVSHGGPGGFDQGLMYGRHLRDSGCELIAPSRPGYLDTPLESGRSPAEQADLMVGVLDEMGIEQATILGYSSGGPAAVQLAARHPHRVNSLLLDSTVTMQYEAPVNVVERLLLFSSFGAWCWSHVGRRRPKLAANSFVDGFSTGLDKEHKQQAVDWIRSDESRQQLVSELWMSFGPWSKRRDGYVNDERNEPTLEPLPFSDIACPTLIAHGTNDGAVPVGHAHHAADKISGAELIEIDHGHHLLPAAQGFDAVLERQLELIGAHPGEMA